MRPLADLGFAPGAHEGQPQDGVERAARHASLTPDITFSSTVSPGTSLPAWKVRRMPRSAMRSGLLLGDVLAVEADGAGSRASGAR